MKNAMNDNKIKNDEIVKKEDNMEKLIKEKIDALESYVIELIESLKSHLMSLENLENDLKNSDLKFITGISSLITNNKERLDYLKAILKESNEKAKTSNTQNLQENALKGGIK